MLVYFYFSVCLLLTVTYHEHIQCQPNQINSNWCHHEFNPSDMTAPTRARDSRLWAERQALLRSREPKKKYKRLWKTIAKERTTWHPTWLEEAIYEWRVKSFCPVSEERLSSAIKQWQRVVARERGQRLKGRTSLVSTETKSTQGSRSWQNSKNQKGNSAIF